MSEKGSESSGNGPSAADEPKIRVDSDWKRQAQAEKERLARELEEAGPSGAAAGEDLRLPPANFSTLAQNLATQAMIFLADQRDPKTGESLQRLDLAKHYIDLLSVLEEKTESNLSDEERRLLDTLLHELRMAYVGAVS